MNERIKELRKQLNLSQEKFGKKLGVTKSAISRMELGTYKITDTMIKLICSNFNVDKNWLLNGVGKMFIEPDTFSLDEYAKTNKLTSLELDIIKSYMELDNETRNKLMSHLKNAFTRHFNNETAAAKESTDNDTPTIPTKDKDVESFEEYKKREVEAYALEIDATSKGEISSVSENQKGA